MKDLNGRTAVITGGASGIGRAMAERFAREGMNVVLADIEQDALDATVGNLRDGGASAVGVRTDVSAVDDVLALADAARREFGPVHLLCNNAGVGGGGSMRDLTTKDWAWVLGVNLWGVVNGLTAFLPSMLDSGEPGHIVNTGSVAGLVASPMMGPYNASKFAVVAISETLHHELSLSGAAVKVSVLCPGWVNTRIHESERNRPADLAVPDRVRDEARAQLLSQVLAAGLSPAAVADAVHEAVVNERFWILTHPEMLPAVEARLESIRSGTNPQMSLGLLESFRSQMAQGTGGVEAGRSNAS